MYEELLNIGKKYVGVSATIFINRILENANVDKNNITDKDLDAIVKSAVKTLDSYGLDKRVYSEPVKRDILGLKKQ